MNQERGGRFLTMRHLAGKVWAVFIVSLVTTAGAFYWSYINYHQLTVSLEELSRPGEEAEIINETFRDLAEADNHIHSYILTGDTASRTSYRKAISRVRNNIEAFRWMASADSAQSLRIDSLKSILDLKIKYLQRFLRVKKLRESSRFTSQAFDSIAVALNDTAYTEKQYLKREVVKGEEIPIEKRSVVVTPDNFRGVSGFVRKVLGRDHTRIDTVNTVERGIAFMYDVSVDSSIVRDYFRDSALVAVKGVLEQVMEKEMRLQARLVETELGLLNQNKMLISNIRTLLEELRDRQALQTTVNKQSARQHAARSTRILLYISGAGLVTSGMLIFLVLRDVTRASHYRSQLEREKSKAEKLARAKEEFLANMSHDIRTPLHNILGFSSMLKNTSLSERQRHYMKAIEESNAYLKELVDDILDQSRIDAGKLQLAAESFDVSALINELVSVYRFSAAQKHIALRTDVPEGLQPTYVVGDAFRLKQVLNNLVSNAVKFTNSGSIAVSLAVEIWEGVADLRICVRDTGPGIAADQLPHIFDPFVQEGPGIARAYGGTGLGLSIVKRLVEAMGGTVEAANIPRGGAMFTIALKLPVGSEPEPNEEAEGAMYVFPEVRVMVVEDDDWNALLLKEILTPRVKELKVFSDAHAALDYLKEGHELPDIIFTDISMPGMQGDSFMQRVKGAHGEIVVVAVTAHVEFEMFDTFKGKGFNHICRKPFTIKDIEDILRRYFGGFSSANPSRSVNAVYCANAIRFDFSGLQRFSAGDDILFTTLVRQLVRNSATQLERFKSHLHNGDYHGVASVSHQMKPTYEMLKLSVSESLSSIVLHERMGNTSRILKIAEDIAPELERIVGGLTSFRDREVRG